MRLPQKIIDANVILRFFLADQKGQFQKAKTFFQKIEEGQEEALLTEMVFAEVVWVLNKVYAIPRKTIAENFSKLIQYRGIKTLIPKEVFVNSLKQYPIQSADIQDVFLAGLAKFYNGLIITFDQTDFKRLESQFTEP